MRYIDYSNFKPDAEWLKKAKDLTDKMIELHKQGKLEERNKLMEDNSAHWGKLKEELLKLSHNKCWFSETKDLYSHYDVEHFRPKKEAKDLAGKDIGGYWWLAFDYHNYRICGNVGNRKKGGWFPLKENSPKSKHDDPCEESELIYLIDPIIPEDVNLLAFDHCRNGDAQPNVFVQLFGFAPGAVLNFRKLGIVACDVLTLIVGDIPHHVQNPRLAQKHVEIEDLVLDVICGIDQLWLAPVFTVVCRAHRI